MRAYYQRRAPEYDDWYLGVGRYAELDRPGWDGEVATLERTIARLPPASTLDVACGTGFLTRHLPGRVTGLDQSEAMLEIARERVPRAKFVVGDALVLPFEGGSFERVFTGHFYGHLEKHDRVAFLREARRVAGELVVADSALRPEVPPETVEERRLSDGSEWTVYKRYFEPDSLAEELGGGRVLHAGRWFVVVAA